MSDLDLKWDAAGLVTVVVQDRHTGEVRMVAHADAAAIGKTLETHQAWFYSRSRASLWRKGETSGNVLDVAEVWVDCDGDAVLYLVDPAGPSCHTGAESCFFRRLDAGGAGAGEEPAAPTFVRLERTLAKRATSEGAKSYTRSLLDAGAPKIGAKVEEEAGELARALAAESAERVISEHADLTYHALVGLLFRGLGLRAVAGELARRFGRSGHDEKASRPR